jgi:hypothetical protein
VVYYFINGAVSTGRGKMSVNDESRGIGTEAMISYLTVRLRHFNHLKPSGNYMSHLL